jgi:hypothetical protein
MALLVAVAQAHSQPETRRTTNLIQLLSNVLSFATLTAVTSFIKMIVPVDVVVSAAMAKCTKPSNRPSAGSEHETLDLSNSANNHQNFFLFAGSMLLVEIYGNFHFQFLNHPLAGLFGRKIVFYPMFFSGYQMQTKFFLPKGLLYHSKIYFRFEPSGAEGSKLPPRGKIQIFEKKPSQLFKIFAGNFRFFI